MYSKQHHATFPPASVGIIDQQAMMQNLNERLEDFLGKVRNLEAENVMLEHQIDEWNQKNEPVKKDYSKYDKEIEELIDMVCQKTVENAQLAYSIESAQIEAYNYQNSDVESGAKVSYSFHFAIPEAEVA
ncbi:keratin, type I cytoskeletal 18-like [Protopterus annectens]|uniref:keratin, type I cytoskeletal 18-like n=1 Tax=Protopterus annectens TaxID=7888 RepID=UPI001CFB92ED|nr:keratin, type I cytoskeletal 18-like [Protopterus annectens]